VSLSAIARLSGLAKSNVYRYFASREEIFLHLLVAAEHRWVADVERSLLPLKGCGDPDRVGSILAETATRYPRLCELGAQLASVLEQNLSEKTILWFKEDSVQLSMRLGHAVSLALPSFSPTEAPRLLRYLYAAVAGLWPSAHPPPEVARVIMRPHLAQFRCDFSLELKTMTCALLRGLSAA
jgi:AcrR family transcriptional regulator